MAVLWWHKYKVGYTTSDLNIDTTKIIRHAFIKNISLGKQMFTSLVNDPYIFRILYY